jgi:6-phosphogluconolactonase/glucosamine-6-phosphate isomerase/deaminase
MSMARFIKTDSAEPVINYLFRTLTKHLGAGERVLWLVSGGSAVTVAADVARRLRGHQLEGLVASLTDERFGPVGHPDSNWAQLAAAGFVLPGATLLPVLTPGATLESTAATFGRTLEARLAAADFSLGFFGIGPDGHTAGILPHSPAVTARSFAIGYDARHLPPPAPGDPTFKRVTMTAPAIARLREAVVYAVGKAKWPVLDELAREVPLADQPAQVLKSVRTLTIFNDHRGEQA